MRVTSSWQAWIAFTLFTFSGCLSSPPQRPPHIDNGIRVDVKVYDTAALRAKLASLSGQLSLLSGVDQSSLISRIGALQGSYSNQFSAALQATTLPTPQLQTQTQTGTPSTSNTTYTPTPLAVLPDASNLTSAQYNQNQVNTPGNTTTNSLSNTPVTPAPAPLPAVQPAAMPTSFSTSAVDALNEEMQLSYQIINLQMVLQGAVSDDYDAKDKARRHLTLGFPISVSAGSQYQGKVAEVSVRVCSPKRTQGSPQPGERVPRLQTIIPQEKTYNVAGLVSHSTSLGLGGIIAGVVNVGASVGSSKQTYYLVKQQDTVALPAFDEKDLSGYQCPLDGDAPNETQSLGFAWQFRPVLDHKAVDEGIRTTFAQISLPPMDDSVTDGSIHVVVQSCWRDYDAKAQVVGKVVSGSCTVAGALERDTSFAKADDKAAAQHIQRSRQVCLSHPDSGAVGVWCYQNDVPVELKYDTLPLEKVAARDNRDGTMTVTVKGAFPQSTRVAIGTMYLDPSTIGFENSGASLRFTANAQLLALNGARLLSADFTSKDVQLAVQTKLGQALKKESTSFAEILSSVGPSMIKSVQAPARVGADASVERAEAFDPTQVSADDLKQPFAQSRLSLLLTPPIPGAKPCTTPLGDATSADVREAKVLPYSDTEVEIELDLWRCLSDGREGTGLLNPVVILGGQVFGLSNAPFLHATTSQIDFHAPRALVGSQSNLIVKPMFMESIYTLPFSLPVVPTVSSAAVQSATRQRTTFLLAGAYLNHLDPTQDAVKRWGVQFSSSPAYAQLVVPTPALATLKQVVFAGKESGVPGLVLPLPDGGSPKESVVSSGAALFGVSMLDAGAEPDKPKDKDTPAGNGAPAPSVVRVTYTITANDSGLDSLEGAQVLTFAETPAEVKSLVPCRKQDGTLLYPSKAGRADVLWSNREILVFGLAQPAAKSLKQIALVLSQAGETLRSCDDKTPGGGSGEPRVYLLDLPKAAADAPADAKPKAFSGKGSIVQGSTGPLVIRGDGVDQIVTVSYGSGEMAVRYSDGATIVDVIPAALAQKAGTVPLGVKLKDGSHNAVLVEITAKKS